MDNPVSQHLPHGESAVLLAHIIDTSDTTATCCIRRDRKIPFAQPDGIPSYVGIEIMAQAAALLINLTNRMGAAKGGRLTHARAISWTAECLPMDRPIYVSVELGDHSQATGLFRFSGKIYAELDLPISEALFSILIIKDTDS